MRKFTHLAVATAALSIIACSGNTSGYVVTGTVEGTTDGDTVFLQELTSRGAFKLDTAIVKNGSFTLKGTQDSAVSRYITCKANNQEQVLAFFLENGKINIVVAKDNKSATGTPSNDIYQAIRTKTNFYSSKLTSFMDNNQDAATLHKEYSEYLKEETQKNITNAVGVFLFKHTSDNYSPTEIEVLLEKMPAHFKNDDSIMKIAKAADKKKQTAEGASFVDFEMLTPEGKPVKLSDYVGKGKVVLIDFWASWCGPCIKDMPNLVDIYANYKGKNFEIVGVSLDKDNDNWKKAIRNLKITWPQMSDLKGWKNEGAQLYAVNSIPHTVLIDGDGTILAHGLRGEALKAQIAEVVK